MPRNGGKTRGAPQQVSRRHYARRAQSTRHATRCLTWLAEFHFLPLAIDTLGGFDGGSGGVGWCSPALFLTREHGPYQFRDELPARANHFVEVRVGLLVLGFTIVDRQAGEPRLWRDDKLSRLWHILGYGRWGGGVGLTFARCFGLLSKQAELQPRVMRDA